MGRIDLGVEAAAYAGRVSGVVQEREGLSEAHADLIVDRNASLVADCAARGVAPTDAATLVLAADAAGRDDAAEAAADRPPGAV